MTPIEQGQMFWDDSPKSPDTERGYCGIMFQVGNTIPIYCYNIYDWADYVAAAFPAKTTTMLFVEGPEDIQSMLWGLRTARVIGNCLEILNDGLDWDEHNGVTTA